MNYPKISGKKVLIITLCKSPNAGAYLQAFSLMQALKQRGLQPSFLDVYDFNNNLKRFRFIFRRGGRSLLNFSFNVKRYLSFKKAEKELPIINKNLAIGFDAAFVGSDEIWCVTNGSFNIAPEFFGLQLDVNKRFSYAPSVGNASYSDIAQYPEYVAGIKSFDLLSARDSETHAVASAITTSDGVSRVLDPTFLCDLSMYEQPCAMPAPYIAVYSYGMSEERVSEIKAYAKKHDLLLVSPGLKHEWCDINIACSPFQFLTIIKNAKSVITDTFHGTVFAIKYKKNFASYGFEKKKVKDLLESFELRESLVRDGDIRSCSEIHTDYTNAKSILDYKILQSENYLSKCINMIP